MAGLKVWLEGVGCCTSIPSRRLGSHQWAAGSPTKLERSARRTASGVVTAVRLGPLQAATRRTSSCWVQQRASARRGSAATNSGKLRRRAPCRGGSVQRQRQVSMARRGRQLVGHAGDAAAPQPSPSRTLATQEANTRSARVAVSARLSRPASRQSRENWAQLIEGSSAGEGGQRAPHLAAQEAAPPKGSQLKPRLVVSPGPHPRRPWACQTRQTRGAGCRHPRRSARRRPLGSPPAGAWAGRPRA